MPVSQGRGAVNGLVADVKLGRHGDQLASPLHGTYAEHTLAGRLFYTSTVVAGLAIPINTTTAPTVMLWNPSGSGVDAVLGKFAASQASGTAAGMVFGLMSVSNTVEAGSNIATGNLITAFAQDVLGTNVYAGKLNSGWRPRVKSSSQGTNTITAGAWIKTLGIGVGGTITTSSIVSPTLVYDFDGEFALPPGSAVYIASNVASVALFQTSLSWYEVPATS